MTLALTKFKAFGVEIDEAITKKFLQYAEFTITGAATDVSLDLGTYAGTFWTAALANGTYGTSVATPALVAIKAINAKATNLVGVKSPQLLDRSVINAGIVGITSSAGSGGSATEAMTVTGLATTDTVLAVTQKTKGANSLPLLGWSTQASNAITGIWSADPGAGAVIQVTVQRASTAAQKGGYTLAITNGMPEITCAASDGETAWFIQACWSLKEAETPVYLAVG